MKVCHAKTYDVTNVEFKVPSQHAYLLSRQCHMEAAEEAAQQTTKQTKYVTPGISHGGNRKWEAAVRKLTRNKRNNKVVSYVYA